MLYALMIKSKKPETRGYGMSKKLQGFRFTPETIRKLTVAAQQYGMSKTVYTEMALKAQFKKDGIQ